MNTQYKIKMLMFISICFAFAAQAQLSPVNRRVTNPSVPKEQLEKPVTTDTVPRIRPIKSGNLNLVRNVIAESYSILRYADYMSDPDCKSCGAWFYTSSANHSTTKAPSSKNWKKQLAWKRIPQNTAYGKWQISLQPFALATQESDVIIREGIIETKGADSVLFTIDYADDANMQSGQSGFINVNKQPIKIITSSPVKTREPTNQTATISNVNQLKLNPAIYSSFAFKINGDRKFYIRIIPLDINKNELQKISNAVTLQEKFYEFNESPKLEPQLADDYTITAVKYVPVYYGNSDYYSCGIVTGYNGNASDPIVKSFMSGFPIGSTICPAKPKDKPWYEKAFNSVAGFLQKVIDGAANAYNDTKNYLKKKFKELNCDAKGEMAVLNPTAELQKMAPKEVCEYVSGAVFDYGMAAVGLPPSLPTTADFSKLAAGQVVDLACDKLEQETGVPVPDEAREKLKKEFKDNIDAQASKGSVNSGILRVTPHPLGMFQTAYLELEVTRTGNACKKKYPVSFGVSNITTREISEWNQKTQKNQSVTLKNNLFEATGTAVPYLKNVGDKTKVYVVLKPEELYLHLNNDNTMKSIERSPQLGVFTNVPDPTYHGLAVTNAFQLLNNGGSNITFSFGLKRAPGIQSNFVHP
jgi:hypothetical protein